MITKEIAQEIKAAQIEHVNGLIKFEYFMAIISDLVKGE